MSVHEVLILIGKAGCQLLLREFGVGHGGVPEAELSCLLSSLSVVTEPSEVTTVTDTKDTADS